MKTTRKARKVSMRRRRPFGPRDLLNTKGSDVLASAVFDYKQAMACVPKNPKK